MHVPLKQYVDDQYTGDYYRKGTFLRLATNSSPPRRCARSEATILVGVLKSGRTRSSFMEHYFFLLGSSPSEKAECPFCPATGMRVNPSPSVGTKFNFTGSLYRLKISYMEGVIHEIKGYSHIWNHETSKCIMWVNESRIFVSNFVNNLKDQLYRVVPAFSHSFGFGFIFRVPRADT
jgi:hypothetical protein